MPQPWTPKVSYESFEILPGDRWEIPASPDQLQNVILPLESVHSDDAFCSLLLTGERIEILGIDGKKASIRSAEELRHVLSRLLPAEAKGAVYLSCVSTHPMQFLLSVQPEAVNTADLLPGEIQTDQGIHIVASPDDLSLLMSDLHKVRGQLDDFYLSLRAGRLATVMGFEQLFSLPQLKDVELLEHQLKTVQTVLRWFKGRALLCDEVGLGKTIEAGICLLELIVRGLVKRVLILTPPSLVEQWRGEMSRKFSLDFITYDDPQFKELGKEAWQHFDRILASYHTAKLEPHRSTILSQEWDLVIIDEAHHFRNRKTLLWRFASELRKKYILLLTATPVQNNLDELFNLVTLLEPGLLSTARSFQREFVDRHNNMLPRNVEQLHQRLSEVMVRNRRSSVGLQLTRRYAQTLKIALSAEERSLYEQVTDFVRSHLRQAAPQNSRSHLSRMAWVTLQKELGSCSQAVVPTLGLLASNPFLTESDRTTLMGLAQGAGQIRQSAKADRLLTLLKDFPDQMVVFTQYQATLSMLRQRLSEAQIPHSVFHGGLSRMQKEEAIRSFQQGNRLLLSTDSGSEGRNLQFCHAVCNFDLPWNPMKIEQRIGRLSRIGQSRDVYIFNLVAESTIEDAILYLLEAKIHMFELVIGEIDMIIASLEEEREFEDIVAELWSGSENESDFYRQMEILGDKLIAAKEFYLQRRAYDDQLFGNRFEAKG